MLLKMLEQGTAKVPLGPPGVQKCKTRYIWGFNLFKIIKSVKEKMEVRLPF